MQLSLLEISEISPQKTSKITQGSQKEEITVNQSEESSIFIKNEEMRKKHLAKLKRSYNMLRKDLDEAKGTEAHNIVMFLNELKRRIRELEKEVV